MSRDVTEHGSVCYVIWQGSVSWFPFVDTDLSFGGDLPRINFHDLFSRLFVSLSLVLGLFVSDGINSVADYNSTPYGVGVVVVVGVVVRVQIKKWITF